MAHVRTLLLTLATACGLHPALASAIGLGDITLHSALNQPLAADIQLLEVGDLDSSDIHVGLAPEEAYQRSGVDRVAFLNDLRFTPVLRNGDNRIHVVSSRPVREPYLNFIIEVARPNGRLLREFTVLLDPLDPLPPGSRIAAAPAAERASASAERRIVSPPAKRADSAPRPAPPAAHGKRYTVASGDSLWLIAKRFAGSADGTAQRLMRDGILALNPQAFVGGDSHRLRAGESLLLPDSATASTVVQGQPVSPASVQPSPAGTAPSTPVIAAPAADLGAASVPLNAAQMAEVQRRVEQQLADSEKERLQLRKDILELQLKLEQLQQQVTRKDHQVGELQAQLAEQPAANDTATPTAPDSGSADSASAPVPVATPATDATGTPVPGGVDEPAADTSIAPAAASQPPAPAVDEEPERLGNLLSLLAVGLALLFLVLLAFYLRRRRPAQRVREPLPTPPPAEPMQVLQVEALPVQPLDPDVPVTPQATIVRPPVPPRSPVIASDALEGANIYIAYGRFGEARSALVQAIEREPQRLDLRLRLLEVLGELGDAPAFAEEETNLLARHGDPQVLGRIKARYPAMSRAAAGVAPLVDAAVVPDPFDELFLDLEAEGAEAASTPLAEAPAPLPAEPLAPVSPPARARVDEAEPDDFQLNLDDLSLDADWDLVSPFEPATPARKVSARVAAEEQAAAFDAEFSSNLQALPEVLELDVAHVDEFGSFAELAGAPAEPSFLDQVEDVSTPPDAPLDVDLDHLAGNREHLSKLNQALAYIEQGDMQSACEILDEVISEGDDRERRQARELLARIA